MKRFWDKVDKGEHCWEWKASIDPYGYGRFHFLGKTNKAHHVVWFLTFYSWPKQWILHKCNNRKCVRPTHLYEGTPMENTKDSIKAGTFKLVPRIKLDDHLKKEIVDKYILGFSSLRKLAKEYNVTHSSIRKVLLKSFKNKQAVLV